MSVHADDASRPVNTANEAGPPNGVRKLLGSTSSLYVAFGLIYGVMQGGLPPLLRSRGIDLAAIGWGFIVLIPFGLTFLWAPLIDAVRPLRNAPRIGWIVPMQALIVLMLLVVAEGEAWPPALLLLLGLVIAFAAATMDVALDALCTARVPALHRPTAGGLKVASLALGAIGGGGVFVAVSVELGWAATFRLCAVVSALSVLPILLNRSWDRDSLALSGARPDLLAVIRHPAGRHRMVRLTLVTCAMAALSFLNRVMLVDLGVPVATIGWIVGTAAPLSGLVASLLAVPILRQAGPGRGIALFTGLCLLAAAALGIGAWRVEASLAIAGAIVMNAGTSGFFVIVCATTLGWARGSQPATDYAVLYGVSRLVATILVIGLAHVAQLIGWPAYYAGTAMGMLVIGLTVRGAFEDQRAV
ncbi:MFS transporter [Methylobacterium sp. WL18]|uniref:MFS transporter n=1 Tax=Methylobacterium sp. WL18 TaxID=2603897 RepID=UPI0016503F35|nr:MFS transporter [Methylobacterium sp. WL18]